MTNILCAVLLAAVATVESGNNPAAYNRKENAVGIYQVRQLAVDDLNRKWKTSYRLEDFYNAQLSQAAFLAYGKMNGATNAESYCRIWNGGPHGMKKKATLEYWEKVRKRLEINRITKGEINQFPQGVK